MKHAECKDWSKETESLSVLCQTSHLLVQKKEKCVEKARHCDEIIGWMRNIVKFKLIPAQNAIITFSLSLSLGTR